MDHSFKTRWRLLLIDQWQIIKEQTQFSGKQALVAIVLAAAMAGGGLLAARQSRLPSVKPETTASVKTARKKSLPKTPKEKKIYVHVSGAVATPGLYKVGSNSRVDDAVKAAGGPTAESNTDNLNLAAKIADGQKITVPLKGAVPESSGLANDDVNQENTQDSRININTATAEELERLNGIGPVLAERIITWRVGHGGFKSVRQLDDVKGIGIKKFSLLKDLIRTE